MADIQSERWLWIKGILFAVIGVFAAGLLLLEMQSAKQRLLFLLAIWGFCRSYYFAFYVIEKYADPGFRFAGLVYLPQYIYGRWNRSSYGNSVVKEHGNLSWYVQWPLVFLLVNLSLPAIQDTWADSARVLTKCEFGLWMAENAFLVMAGALGPFRLLARCAFALGMHILMGLSLRGMEWFALQGNNFTLEMATLSCFVMLWLFRVATGLRIGDDRVLESLLVNDKTWSRVRTEKPRVVFFQLLRIGAILPILFLAFGWLVDGKPHEQRSAEFVLWMCIVYFVTIGIVFADAQVRKMRIVRNGS